MMFRCICASVLVLLGCVVPCATAVAGVVAVSKDVTVNATNPDSNLNAITTRGGLLSGLDSTGSDYRFYLQFTLPPLDVGSIKSATLIGTYTDDYGSTDSFHQLYSVPNDAWSENAVTWNNRPEIGAATADGFNAINAVPGDTIHFDVTNEVKAEAAGDGVISFALTTIDGRFGDLEYFASREFDSARAFRIQIDQASAIPLPSAAPAGFALACCIGLARLGRHWISRLKAG